MCVFYVNVISLTYNIGQCLTLRSADPWVSKDRAYPPHMKTKHLCL